MRIYLIRHGEAVDDIEDCYGGIADFALTDRGREQGRDLGGQLRGEEVQAIYSSPLCRAREFAMIVADRLGGSVPVRIVEDLQERNSYGVFSGVSRKRARELFGRILSQLKEKPGYSREPIVGAEEFDGFLLRVQRAFASVLDDAHERRASRIALITHGKFMQALGHHVLRLEGEIDRRLGALNVIEYHPATAAILRSAPWTSRPMEAVPTAEGRAPENGPIVAQ